MAQALDKTCEVEKRNQLLQTSSQLYGRMLQLLESLGNSPGDMAVTLLQSRMLQFQDLQRQIEAGDSQLSPLLAKQTDIDARTLLLIEERKSLLEQVLTHNQKVKIQAQAIRSLINSEIQKHTKGHNALQGYKQSDGHQRTGTFNQAM